MGELFAYDRILQVPMERVPLNEKEGVFLLKRGDLLFARQSLVREGAGRCVIFKDDDEPVTFESHIIRVRLDVARANPCFFYYWFRSPQGRIAVDSIIHQVAAAGIRGSDLAKLLVPCPLLSEQQAIAQVLMSLDDKIDLNRRMNETLEQTAQGFFEYKFVNISRLPEGWRLGSLDELQAEIPNAITAGPFGSKLGRADYVDSGIPVIRGGNLGRRVGEWFLEDDFVFVSAEKVQRDLSSCIARRGDVLFTQRGTLGQVGMIPFDATYTEFVVSQSQMKMTCAAWVPPEYIVVAFKRPQSVEYIKANAVAVGVPHINLGFLRRFPLLIPTKNALAEFGEVVRPLHLRMRANVVESRTLTELRDLLLPKLLSGELRIRDAERAVEAVA